MSVGGISRGEVRALGVQDVVAYHRIRAEMLVDSPASFGSSPEDDRCADLEFVRSIVRHSTNGLFGYFEGGECHSVAGIAVTGGKKRAHIAQVYGVYTRPAARRRGLSRRVMEAVLDHAATVDGVEVVQLSVSAESPGAQALYTALGFQVWGEEPRALRIGDRRPAEIHMWRELSPETPWRRQR